jgi:hypothetical protein
MRHVDLNCPVPASRIAAVLAAALIGTALLSPMRVHVARAQTEPPTAANGVLLPPPDFDPVTARNGYLIESADAPVTSSAPDSGAAESTATDAPEAVADAPDVAADAPETGNSVTTSLGGADVAVSSVGGSNEVDSPKKRSDRKK